MILIIGTPDDMVSVYMQEKLQAAGLKTVMFDTLTYPAETQITIDPDGREGFFQAGPHSPRIPIADFVSVYRRWSKGINAPREDDPVLNEIVYWNIESAVGSFFRCLDCLWVNSAEATDMHRYKGYQLKLLRQAGIRVPHTMMTNSPESVRAFYEQMGKNIIFKPVRGWAHTQKLTEADFTPERLETLSRTPVKLQECIEGQDLRIYLINGEPFAMEIHSTTLDFRDDAEAPRVPVDLPDSVVADCRTIAKTLDLVFTGIDCRRTSEGEYVFFEANPTPVFLHDEQTSGYPISQRLVQLLADGNP